ncbi:hypothetical protein LguiA_010761 [Lonicera macranthoides]
MVQKKVSNKLGIKDDHVKTEKGLLDNLKQSSSQQHDGKNRGADLKKKMKKSKSIKFSNFESFLSPPPRRGKPQGSFPGGAASGCGFLVPNKQSPAKSAGGSPPLLHTRKPLPPQPPVRQEPPPQPGKPPGSATSGSGFLVPKKQSPIKSTEGSPNYMKPTSSFEARKERSRSPVSTSRSPRTSISPKTPSPKNLINPKHKSSSSYGHKGSRTLSKTSSLKLVRTLTKSPSFKPSRSLSKKCSPVVLCEDFDVQRATCSSTLKDSKFPNYLTLNPGATEAEGTSAIKVCPYTYCSLNGHHHAPLPPLKSFLSAKRRLLKTQKSFKLGCLSPRRNKPKESDSKSFPIEPLVQEERGDFFIEIYTKDCEGDEKVEENFHGEILERVLDESTCIDAVSLPSSAKETSGNCSIDDRDKEEEEERKLRIQLEEVDTEGSNMDWEAGEYSEAYVEDISSHCFKELVPDEVMEVLFDEESVSSEAWFDDRDSESSHSSSNLERDGFEESTNKEERTCALIKEINEEPKQTIEDSNVGFNNEIPRMVEDEIKCVCNIKDEELVDHNVNESPQDGDYSCLFLSNQDMESCQDFLEQALPAVDAREEIEENESLQDDGYSCLFLGNQESDSCQDDARDETEEIESSQEDGYSCLFVGDQELDSSQDLLGQELPTDEKKKNESSQTSEDVDASNQVLSSEGLENGTEDQLKNDRGNQEYADKDLDETKNFRVPNVQEIQDFDRSKVELTSKSDEEVKISTPEEKTSEGTKNPNLYKRRDSKEESLEACKYPKWGVRAKKIAEESEEERKFNPMEPNYLPVEPDEDAEKVDLRHQMVDERKNAEEWMVDFALRRAVTSLAPARKRKVALLVEAFETVMPIPKYESHFRHNSSFYGLSSPIQACR